MAVKKATYKVAVHGHRLPPGREFTVHFTADVNVERVNGTAPLSRPEAKGKVGDDGSLEFTVHRRGSYTVAGELDNGRYAYTATAAK